MGADDDEPGICRNEHLKEIGEVRIHRAPMSGVARRERMWRGVAARSYSEMRKPASDQASAVSAATGHYSILPRSGDAETLIG